MNLLTCEQLIYFRPVFSLWVGAFGELFLPGSLILEIVALWIWMFPAVEAKVNSSKVLQSGALCRQPIIQRLGALVRGGLTIIMTFAMSCLVTMGTSLVIATAPWVSLIVVLGLIIRVKTLPRYILICVLLCVTVYLIHCYSTYAGDRLYFECRNTSGVE
jgi:hypothetical protein